MSAERSGPYTSTSKGTSEGKGGKWSSERIGPYTSTSKGTSEGKGSKWNPERVTPEQLVTYESIFKATSKGSKDTSKGKGSKASFSKGSKDPSKGKVPLDFSRMGGKGELLRRLWNLAELDFPEDRDWNPELEEQTKNNAQRIRNIIDKRRTRMAQAIEVVHQLHLMETEYVREWRRANNTSECPPGLMSLSECIPAEFWQLL